MIPSAECKSLTKELKRDILKVLFIATLSPKEKLLNRNMIICVFYSSPESVFYPLVITTPPFELPVISSY